MRTINKGVQSYNWSHSYFVTDLNIHCDSSQLGKEYNYNQSILIQMLRNESHNHHVMMQTNMFVR